ncbi:NAD(P)-binding protein [Auriculariales sp. MPI-PUGE-AT-0066]|nr:NAD(P)-binding protein [Auriculariales sp. MPI-PUGE-AT-0066]
MERMTTPRGFSSRGASPNRLAGTLGADIVHPHDAMLHSAFHKGNVAVVTGGASGIGKAAVIAFAEFGMRVAVADRDATKLQETSEEVKSRFPNTDIVTFTVDVSKYDEVSTFADRVYEWAGTVSVVLNNAGIGPVGGKAWEGLDQWRSIIDVNLMGVVNVQQAFVPHMLPNENPSLFINTGSKQGITNPPGNAAYNASKAAVKSLTEGLAHELRQRQSVVTAHLLIPGWTWTPLGGQSSEGKTKPPGAWTPQQVVKYMLDQVHRGAFYIVCPDNETSSVLDRLRIRWAAEDIIEGRSALSRWDPDYAPLFEEYIRAGLVGGANHQSLSRSISQENLEPDH